MVEPITALTPEAVAANLARVRETIADTGRDPSTVEVLAAIKYLGAGLLPALAAGGITSVGENRAQELVTKQDAYGELFTSWDFIGQLQSRKVKDLVGRVRYIESLASRSAIDQLAKDAGPEAGDGTAAHRVQTEALIEVNVAGDPGKSGIAPAELTDYLDACPIPVRGLMTMPPYAEDPEDNRRHFAALAGLAAAHGLDELSMGTSQDYGVAVAEGATIIRLGSTLFAPPHAGAS